MQLALHHQFFYKVNADIYLIPVISLHPICVFTIWKSIDSYAHYGIIQWLTLLIWTIYIVVFSVTMLSVAANLDANTRTLIVRLEKEFILYPWKQIPRNIYVDEAPGKLERFNPFPQLVECSSRLTQRHPSHTRESYLTMLFQFYSHSPCKYKYRAYYSGILIEHMLQHGIQF